MYIKLIDENCLPTKANPTDSGFDLKSRIETTIMPGELALIPSGVCFDIPPGLEVQVRSRSGIALKNMCFVLNSPGTIDSGYTGEVGVILMNLGKEPFLVKKYSRIAQAVVSQVSQCQLLVLEELGRTERGQNGFGSSGV